MTMPRSVMVVDDSRLQREHIAALCRGLGIACIHEAEHGADALASLERLQAAGQAPELLVIDLEMPVMDGVELIQHLRERAPRLPFVLASTREAALLEAVETMARLQGLPVLQCLHKPVAAAAFREALGRLSDWQLAAAAPALRGAQAPAPAAGQPVITPVALAEAIARGHIVPHYQPKVDVRTGVIRGVEVLARWTSAVLGQPAPERFIALAEAQGLIHALTLAIVGQALAQAAKWNARGLVLSVAVNLSPRLLESPALVAQLTELAAEHGLPPSQIVLEITESSVVAAQGAALSVLARLRMKGFGLSIDDYGTGFSSLQQLARVPWTELKIDRSFVDGAHRHVHQRTILHSALEMAQRLSLATVAEGVETMEDWRMLQGFGCSVGQGWLFGRAMPAADLPGWLRRHGRRLAELRAPTAALAASAAKTALNVEDQA
jgi:EAL domain-containing protein (putative c-di-GMP-specific phosphodiesterase class I)/DNA-binding NarL/FixJ family response regulator